MQPSVDTNVTVPPELERLFRHLSHELRQPLSGIESIAYYLDMVLGDCEPEIQQQCERLRRMVQQAHWILEDAALAMRLNDTAVRPVAFASIFTRLGADLALHEERILEIRSPDQLPDALVPGAAAARCCDHLLNFFRGVALARDPIRVTLSCEGSAVLLAIEAQVLADANDLLRLLDPPQHGSGVRRFVEACGGAFNCSAASGSLRVSMTFPAAPQQT